MRAATWLGILTLLGSALPLFGAAAAEDDDFWTRKYLFGDLGGLRSTLEDDGITLHGHYITENSANPSGGARQGVRYTGEVMLGGDADLEKLVGWDGASVHLTLTERAGKSLSRDDIHNVLTVQEIYGSGQTSRITEASLEQKLGRDVDIEVGRINTENDFVASPTYWGNSLYCSFQSNAICGTPIAVPINSGYTAYPVSTWGGRVKYYPVDGTYLETGAYEVNPTDGLTGRGFKLTSDGATGVYLPVEAGLVTGSDKDGTLGNWRVGAYYDTSEVSGAASYLAALAIGKDLGAAIPDASSNGRWGVYLSADRQIEVDPGNSARGIVLFAALQLGDPETAPIRTYAELGLLRRGTFVGRDEDTVGFAVADAEFNGRLGNLERQLQAQGLTAPVQTRETAVELNYTAAVTPWLAMTPGLQYIFHPSGTTEIANAVVLDLRMAVTF